MSEINLQRHACACQFPYEGARFTGTPRVCERCKGEIVDLGAVPPAMQRALGEGEYNQIGEELRKLNVALGESLGTIGEGIAHLMEGQAEQKQRLEPKHKVQGPLEWDWAAAAYIVDGKRVTPEFIEVIWRENQLTNHAFRELAASLQLIMQKLGAIEESARRGAERGERVALSLDRISKRLLALELVGRRARKRQPKPVRRKGRK